MNNTKDIQTIAAAAVLKHLLNNAWMGDVRDVLAQALPCTTVELSEAAMRKWIGNTLGDSAYYFDLDARVEFTPKPRVEDPTAEYALQTPFESPTADPVAIAAQDNMYPHFSGEGFPEDI